jgi:hypothetical protein
MKHLPVSVFKVCSDKSPGVKIGPAPWVIDLYVYRQNLDIFFEKTQIARV